MSNYGERIDKTTVRFERLLPGPIERVWSYLVEPDKRMQWFAAGRTELKSGGLAEFHFDHRRITDEKAPKEHEHHAGDIRFEGRVLNAEPPRLLVFDWLEENGEYSRVRFELAERDGQVKLTLTHSLLEKRETMIDVSGGWHAHLDMLEALLSGAGRPRFWEAITRYEEEYGKRFSE